MGDDRGSIRRARKVAPMLERCVDRDYTHSGCLAGGCNTWNATRTRLKPSGQVSDLSEWPCPESNLHGTTGCRNEPETVEEMEIITDLVARCSKEAIGFDVRTLTH